MDRHLSDCREHDNTMAHGPHNSLHLAWISTAVPLWDFHTALFKGCNFERAHQPLADHTADASIALSRSTILPVSFIIAKTSTRDRTTMLQLTQCLPLALAITAVAADDLDFYKVRPDITNTRCGSHRWLRTLGTLAKLSALSVLQTRRKPYLWTNRSRAMA